jgi:hypothetical protein
MKILLLRRPFLGYPGVSLSYAQTNQPTSLTSLCLPPPPSSSLTSVRLRHCLSILPSPSPTPKRRPADTAPSQSPRGAEEAVEGGLRAASPMTDGGLRHLLLPRPPVAQIQGGATSGNRGAARRGAEAHASSMEAARPPPLMLPSLVSGGLL